jgi:hypothetical protein
MAIPHLTKIQHTQCQDCGCRDVENISIYSKHCNGEWNEKLKFKCGVEYHYFPNFSRILLENPCQKQGVKTAQVEVTIRLQLQLRNDTTLDEEMKHLQIPESPYMWTQGGWQANRDRKSQVKRIELVRWKKKDVRKKS